MVVVTASLLVVLGIIGLGFFYFLLVLFSSMRTRRLRKKYKEEQDASKQGEKRRKLEGGRIPSISRGAPEKERIRYSSFPTSNREPTFEGYDKPQRRELLSTTDAYDVREHKDFDRQISRSYDTGGYEDPRRRESPRERLFRLREQRKQSKY